MNLSELSIKRPIFITCIVLLMLAVGLVSMFKLPVDLFPNVTFPVVTISTVYPGAGPQEIETLVSKVFEDEISTLPGVKALRSINKEGISIVITQFSLETDVKYAEQQIRDRVASAKRKLPSDAKEPVIRRIDPADQPVAILSVHADLPPAALFDLVDQTIKPRIEQVDNVGLVEILGGRKREVRVELDPRKLKDREVSATQVSQRIAAAGQNIPLGKVLDGQTGNDRVLRAVGQFATLDDISRTVVNFMGNDVPVTVADVGRVIDGLEDEKSQTYYNGKPALFLMVFRQSGSNTVAVVDSVGERIKKMQTELQASKVEIKLVRDGAKPIRANLVDVSESIFIGITLTILVVFFFLGSVRSTLITGVALPNSLIGAFILMAVAGFSINVMTLLAISLSVGLLIDDAIVVRENIFRHIEEGEMPVVAAIKGTREVTVAVIATTLTVIAVFGPIAFLQGIVGQFFREFGLTICFAMAISLFDALTMAPMLSAYFAGKSAGGSKGHQKPKGVWERTVGVALRGFDRFQTHLENGYEKVLRYTIRWPITILLAAVAIFVGSIQAAKYVPKTFLPTQDFGEFEIYFDLPPGSSLQATSKIAVEVEALVRSNKEVLETMTFVGNRDGDSQEGRLIVNMVPSKDRAINTSRFKDLIREQLKKYAVYRPRVQDVNMVGVGERPFNVNIAGENLEQIEKVGREAFAKLKDHPAFKDADISYRPGRPEFQVILEPGKAERLGVSNNVMGMELRTQIEGAVPAVFRENGREYDIRVRYAEKDRDLWRRFDQTYVPNVNFALIKLPNIARGVTTTGPATINRQDRQRFVQISADMAPEGPGMGKAMEDITELFTKEQKLPPGVTFQFVGQAENFKELAINMLIASGLGMLFIYLVLASLYESFIIPMTIMLVLPLAMCGALFGLLAAGKSLDIFSMIGCILLLGIATKNSILLVDAANQALAEGLSRTDAILRAGRLRLRPILMTTIALIAGMLPIAMGLNEASKQRTSMGVAVIGGLISSTLLSLLVVPAAFSYFDRLRVWTNRIFRNATGAADFSDYEVSDGKSVAPGPTAH
ncbi:MAG: efflux RND transporter permease subunit [Bdellovibrionota bacterium]